jgi:hypothetical protein
LNSSEHQQRLQFVGTITRVSSVISPYLSRFSHAEGAFPADAIVQSAWRELGGSGAESLRRAKWKDLIVHLRPHGLLHQAPVAVAVSKALGGISLISDLWDAPDDALGAARDVANEIAGIFDSEAFIDADVSDSWVSYEGNSASRLATMAIDESVFSIRLESGMQSMPYRRAILENVGM